MMTLHCIDDLIFIVQEKRVDITVHRVQATHRQVQQAGQGSTVKQETESQEEFGSLVCASCTWQETPGAAD